MDRRLTATMNETAEERRCARAGRLSERVTGCAFRGANTLGTSFLEKSVRKPLPMNCA
jgi:hypothetical protein